MKLKTHQSIAKRFIITKRRKILKRKNGQAHFNSRERGRTTRAKRRDVSFSKEFGAFVKQQLPYN